MNFRQASCGWLTLVFATQTAAIAEDGQTLAAKFGALETVQDISISPNGNSVIFIAPDDNDARGLYIVDMAAGSAPKRIVNANNKNDTLRWCSFASDVRLICQISTISNDSGTLLGFSRLVALNTDGTGIALIDTGANSKSLGFVQNGGSIIDWNVPEKSGSVLMTHSYIPEFSTGTRMASSTEGLGVDIFDAEKMKRKPLEQANALAVGYVSDGKGSVRLMVTRNQDANGYDKSTLNWYFRKLNSRGWEALVRTQTTATGSQTNMDPVAVDSTKNLAYAFGDNAGRQALFSLSLDGSAARQLVMSRPDVDVDSLIRIGRDRRVVGASYATERRTIEFFDPDLKKLGSALGRAIPGNPNIAFVDASQDESKLLMFASSDVDPGMFYMFDKSTRHLEQVLPVRGALDGVVMGQMKPITFTTSDGTKVPAYLTLPPGSSGKGLPAIVMPHGGPGARDEWGFDWLVQYFAVRGFAVIQPNYRGSAGYGSGWYQKNGFQSWRTAIGDVNDAGRFLVSEGIADPAKLAIVGWSYGGYAALQSSVLDPKLFKAIVAVAPVTDLEKLRQEASRYTSFSMVDQFIGHGPHVREGSPLQNVEAIKVPVLMFHGDKDQNVGVDESRAMASKLKSVGKEVTYVEFPGLDHQLPSAAARTRLLSESDAFLRKAMGMPAN